MKGPFEYLPDRLFCRQACPLFSCKTDYNLAQGSNLLITQSMWLLSTEVCPPPPPQKRKTIAKALTPNVRLFGDRAFREGIKVK